MIPSFSLPCRLACFGFALLSCVGLSQTARAQNQTINGDLAVAGQVDINGNTLLLGSWPNDSTRFGLSVIYAENATTRAATLTFTATRPVSGWLWQEAKPNNAAGSAPQMFLSSGNVLTLYDQATPTPNAAIVLDPSGASSFAGSVTVNGVNNQMPNQTLTGSASVLTMGLADLRYALRGTGNKLSLGYSASATGTNATALGAYTAASGSYSTALSYGSVASGSYTVALGNGSQALGATATAVGTNSAASGDNSVSLGNSSLASGWGSVVVGVSSLASGAVATALGSYSQASGTYSMTLGHNSAATGSAASALGVYSTATADYATALGFASHATGGFSSALGAVSTASGSYSTALGHASVASGAGAASLGWYSVASGNSSIAAGQTTASSAFQMATGRYGVVRGNATDWVPTDDLFTVGNGTSDTARSNAFVVKKNGDTEVTGKLKVTGAIRVAPQGDLAMGVFTAEPSPAP